jgi:hypothetical protein
MSTKELEAEVRAGLQALARGIKASLPEDFGFALLVTAAEPGAALLYVATLDRGDVLQLMREFIATNREERVWQREMPEVELSEEFDQWWAAQLKRKGVQPNDMNDTNRSYSPFMREWCRDAFNAGRASA